MAVGALPEDLGCQDHSLKSTGSGDPRVSSIFMMPPKNVYSKEKGDTPEPKDETQSAARIHCAPHGIHQPESEGRTKSWAKALRGPLRIYL